MRIVSTKKTMKRLFLTLLCLITRKSGRVEMFTGIIIDVGTIKVSKKEKRNRDDDLH